MATIRICENDGTEFEAEREHARFCSARCRVAWNRAHPTQQDKDEDRADRVVRATKELIRAAGDASWLRADEIQALTDNGCAVWENGRLLLTQDWVETWHRAWKSR